MKLVFLALLWVSMDAAGPSRDSARSRSRSPGGRREVDEYLRSMTKIKPQWSDEKILRSARGIYGDGWVPGRIPEHVRHVPGTVSSRPGSSVHRVEGMSSDDKKQEVYRIRDRNPALTTRDIVDEFAAMYPMEPNPPDKLMVGHYLFFRKIDERVASLPNGDDWRSLGRAQRSLLSKAGRQMVSERMAIGWGDSWEEIVEDVVSRFYAKYNIKLQPASVYKWYIEDKKARGEASATN